MAYFFGDSFDLYAATADAVMNGTYWDSGANVASAALGAGRFAGSQSYSNSLSTTLVKSSGANDAIHHFVVSFMTTSAITGSSLGAYIELFDGATAQCTVVYRTDGAILLASGGPTGTVLATYAGAVTASNVWYGFEIEVVIHNTAGSIAVRKNGNPSNDYFLGSLNTRASANNYANKIQIGSQTGAINVYFIDDFLWRSDPSSVPWVGDIRCYVRRPASDASVQWSRLATFNQPGLQGATTAASLTIGQGRYTPFIGQGGSVGSVTVTLNAGYTGNMKCAIFSDNGSGAPGAVLQSATAAIANPVIGANTFTFSPAVSITAGTKYWVGLCADAATGSVWLVSNVAPFSIAGCTSTGTYAAFPVASPTVTAGAAAVNCSMTVTPAANMNAVNDQLQDGAASYVYDSTIGDSDLYGLSSLSATPTTIVGCVTRALCQKSDAGTRNVQTQLKSGGTTSSGTSTALNTTFGWIYQTNLTDPATGSTWTAVGVNNAQIGQVVSA